jgi:Zn-dependent protease
LADRKSPRHAGYNRGVLGLTLPDLLSRLITLIVALTFHELAHALVATRLGDTTAAQMGRLSVNPLRHLDPLGSLMLVAVGFGWAKPVPVNPYNLRPGPRTGMGLVSAAGPLANLTMAALAALPFAFGLVGPEFVPRTRLLPTAAFVLTQFVTINIILAIFNLLPLAPLDGEKVVGSFLRGSVARAFDQLQRYGPLILIVLVFALPLIGIDPISWLIRGVGQTLFSWLVSWAG